MTDEKDAGLVSVRPVRRFEGAEGYKTPRSGPFDVSKQRASELAASGLIETKAAPLPQNKMAPDHNNKGDDLDKLTIDQLKALAEKRKIDLGDASKKADIIAAIELAGER